MICNEAALVERATAHDQTAFAELYNAYVDKIYKYIYYKVGDASEAEDLCEQVFLKAWMAIGRYKWSGHPFSSWLYKLAHNLIVDHYRNRRDPVPLSNLLFTPAETSGPESSLYADAEIAELKAAIRRLTHDQQQVVALRFIEGYSNAEIAQMMNKKEGAIRALQYRALRSLQALLQAEQSKEVEFARMQYFDAAVG
jgi:RNA polymerase sigma-70 factor, ECF subfamily